MSGTIIVGIEGRNTNKGKAPKTCIAHKFLDITDCGRQYRETLAEKKNLCARLCWKGLRERWNLMRTNYEKNTAIICVAIYVIGAIVCLAVGFGWISIS